MKSSVEFKNDVITNIEATIEMDYNNTMCCVPFFVTSYDDIEDEEILDYIDDYNITTGYEENNIVIECINPHDELYEVELIAVTKHNILARKICDGSIHYIGFDEITLNGIIRVYESITD